MIDPIGQESKLSWKQFLGFCLFACLFFVIFAFNTSKPVCGRKRRNLCQRGRGKWPCGLFRKTDYEKNTASRVTTMREMPACLV